MHFTLLNRKTLYIDIIESNTNKQKVTSVITLIMLFTRLWFENPFKLSRWTNKYSLTGKKRSILRREEDELPLLCHKGIGITFCSVGILEKRNWSNRNTILTDANIGWVLLKTLPFTEVKRKTKTKVAMLCQFVGIVVIRSHAHKMNIQVAYHWWLVKNYSMTRITLQSPRLCSGNENQEIPSMLFENMFKKSERKKKRDKKQSAHNKWLLHGQSILRVKSQAHVKI